MDEELNGVVCVLTRKNRSEILWVKRSLSRTFMPSYLAFIGGAIEEDDLNLESATARELFEELGIIISTEGIVADIENDNRHEVKTQGSFDAFLKRKNLQIDANRFRQIADWKSGEEYSRTPYIRLFELEIKDDETLQNPMNHIDEEAIFAEWISIEDALEYLDEGRGVGSALVRSLLNNFSESSTRFSQIEELEKLSTYKIHEGIYSIPMKSQTLLPSTTTNCILVVDDEDERFVVIDPGGSDEAEQDRLIRFVEELIGSGLKLHGIALTHHHHDHREALPRLLKHFNCPLFGHEKLGQYIDEIVNSFNTELLPGVLGIPTPGHSDDHLAFYIPRCETLIAGDMVASKGSILVEPERGHLGDYIESLELLLRIRPDTMIPSHGCVIAFPASHLREYLQHRRSRHRSISKHIYDVKRAKPIDLVPEIYQDTPEAFYPLAALSVESHLLFMCESGELKQDGEFFILP